MLYFLVKEGPSQEEVVKCREFGCHVEAAAHVCSKKVDKIRLYTKYTNLELHNVNVKEFVHWRHSTGI